MNASKLDREPTRYSVKVPAEHVGRSRPSVSWFWRCGGRRCVAAITPEKPVIVDESDVLPTRPLRPLPHALREMLYAVTCPAEIAGTAEPGAPSDAPGGRHHWRAAYRTRGMVLAVAGAIHHDEVVRASAGWSRQARPTARPTRVRRRWPCHAADSFRAGLLRVLYRRLSLALRSDARAPLAAT